MSGRIRNLPLWAPEDARHVEPGLLDRLVGSPSTLARDDVGGVPIGPVVLRSDWFVGAVALLGLPQKLCEGRDIHDRSSFGGPGQTRPGSRVVICWSSQPLPSGSWNPANVLYERPSGSGPGTGCPPKPAKWNASLTSTPRPLSSARAASMSDTTRYRFWTEPGAAFVTLLPKWMEHCEPGGVSWTTRKPSTPGKSASSRQPRPS